MRNVLQCTHINKRITTTEECWVPGGFGSRGTDGKIAAAEWARTKRIPYLGKWCALIRKSVHILCSVCVSGIAEGWGISLVNKWVQD